MKKYLIVSDVHGSLSSFNKVLAFFKENRYDQLICLGDLLYHGPRNDLPEEYNPKGIIPQINEIKDKVIMVRGNCDAEVDQMVLNFHIFKVKKINISGKIVHLEHGHHLNKEKYHDGDIVFYGHTHVSKYEDFNGVKYINPGSSSIPKENTVKSFMTIEENKLNLRDLNGNVLESWEF